ncbi:MAG: glutamine amidotransferase [Deltaproteobacteria bacterium]|jgi:GMP synthase (glutamine-hydrolysing)|nr:glutamine amidotransferase [Deltaproteobacteria bacterium]
MLCRVIQHVLFEDLGLFSGVLADRGYGIEYHQAGVDLPGPVEWLEADLRIVMGGPIGVGDRASYPYIEDEINLVRRAVESGGAVLGICLGAQFLAAAMGAAVYPNTGPEIGFGPLELTPAALDSPLGRLKDVPVLHWHGDTFDVPKGAERLASTPGTPNQAFRRGGGILALQFHPETDFSRFEQWLIGHTAELSRHNLDPARLRKEARAHAPLLAERAPLFFNDWLDGLKN